MEEKQISGETEDAIATGQPIIPEIERPKIIITESMDTENSTKRVRSVENSSSFALCPFV